MGEVCTLVLFIMYSSRSHGTVVCTMTGKGRNYCRPRDPAAWPNMAATPVITCIMCRDVPTVVTMINVTCNFAVHYLEII